MNELKPVMTTAEVAAAVGVSSKVILRHERQGTLRRLRGSHKPMRFAGHVVHQWLNGGAK